MTLCPTFCPTFRPPPPPWRTPRAAPSVPSTARRTRPIDIRGAVAEQSNERGDAPVARRLVYRGDAEVVSRVDVRAERQQEVLRVRSDVTYVGVELKGVFSRS
eukprot:30631-Pelagococcus_subviridis.AAC.2